MIDLQTAIILAIISAGLLFITAPRKKRGLLIGWWYIDKDGD